jgi:hypothetical protein
MTHVCFGKKSKLRTLELELLLPHRLASSRAELTHREAPSGTDTTVQREAEASGMPRRTHDTAKEPYPGSAVTHPSLVVADPQRSPIGKDPGPPLYFEPTLTMPRSLGCKDNITGEQRLGHRHSPCRQLNTVYAIVDGQD